MKSISFDYSKALDFITEDEIKAMQSAICDAHKTLTEGTGEGNDFLGW